MTQKTEVLNSAHGVTLKSVSLYNNGAIVDRSYVVQTLRSPETWPFSSKAEAHARFQLEVGICENDSLVQKRLG